MMTYYDFILRFDDELHSLTAKNGLPIDILADLLKHLIKAIQGAAKEPIVISEIAGNCYAIKFTTPSLTVDSNFKLLHNHISQNKYNGFTKEQMDYAKHLGKIMRERKLRINTYDPNKTFNYKLDDVIIPVTPVFYYEVVSVYGIITMIGGNNIDGKSCVKIDSMNKVDIEVDKQQENELLKHFKKDRLRLNVRMKKYVSSGEVKGAILESFTLVSGDFFDITKQIRDNEGDTIFNDIL